MKETDTFTITFTHPTSHKIKPKTPTVVSGPQISSKSDSDLVESTTFTTSWLDTISRLLTEWTSPRENTTILTLITWSLVCQDNYTTVCSITKMELQHPPHKWPTMLPTSLSSWTEEVVGPTLTKKSESGCGLLLASSWFLWDTWTLTDSTETCFQQELKCMPWETLWVTSTGNQDSRASRPATTETLTGRDWFYFIKIVQFNVWSFQLKIVGLKYTKISWIMKRELNVLKRANKVGSGNKVD